MVTQQITDKAKICDSLLDLLIIAYAFGVEDVNISTGEDRPVSKEKMNSSVYKVIDGKTWEDRLKSYDELSQVKILAENEMFRCFSEGQWDCANEIGGLLKTWHTMCDNRVREAHWYLEGDTVPLDEMFYTLSGDGAYYPRGFGIPELDIGCRCWITYRKEMW